MLLFAWLLAQAVSPAPCAGADVAVERLRIAAIRGNASTPDRAVITADVVNVGTSPQSGTVRQHVELLHNGKVIASAPVRPLRVGERYPIALRIFRPVNERQEPLGVIVRYVTDDDQARRENCTTVNDKLEKIF